MPHDRQRVNDSARALMNSRLYVTVTDGKLVIARTSCELCRLKRVICWHIQTSLQYRPLWYNLDHITFVQVQWYVKATKCLSFYVCVPVIYIGFSRFLLCLSLSCYPNDAMPVLAIRIKCHGRKTAREIWLSFVNIRFCGGLMVPLHRL